MKSDEKMLKAAFRSSADLRDIEYKVTSDVTKSENFVEFHRFYDDKRNFKLDFRAIGWLCI